MAILAVDMCTLIHIHDHCHAMCMKGISGGNITSGDCDITHFPYLQLSDQEELMMTPTQTVGATYWADFGQSLPGPQSMDRNLDSSPPCYGPIVCTRILGMFQWAYWIQHLYMTTNSTH